jgi:RecJ-like exonuclease
MGKMKEEFMRLQETPIMDECAECQGSGTVEVEVDACGGGGEVERLCDCGEWVTLIMGEDAKVCEECANE